MSTRYGRTLSIACWLTLKFGVSKELTQFEVKMTTRKQEIIDKYPDCFHQLQTPPHRQRLFINLWHRRPNMAVSELSRQSRLSRPTCYKLIKLLEARGDIRGRTCNGESFAGRVTVTKSSPAASAGDLTHHRRRDLLRVIAVHEDFVNEALAYLCHMDASFKRFRNEDGEVDLPVLIDFLKGKNERRGRKRKFASQSPVQSPESPRVSFVGS